jgi:hypothetical protein
MERDPQDLPGEAVPAPDPHSASQIASAYGAAAASASPATDDPPAGDGEDIAMEGATAAVPADSEDPPLPREGVSEPVTGEGTAR